VFQVELETGTFTGRHSLCEVWGVSIATGTGVIPPVMVHNSILEPSNYRDSS